MRQDPDKMVLKKKLLPFQNAWTLINNGVDANCNIVECPKSTIAGTPRPILTLIHVLGRSFVHSLLSQYPKQFEKMIKINYQAT